MDANLSRLIESADVLVKLASLLIVFRLVDGLAALGLQIRGYFRIAESEQRLLEALKAVAERQPK